MNPLCNHLQLLFLHACPLARQTLETNDNHETISQNSSENSCSYREINKPQRGSGECAFFDSVIICVLETSVVFLRFHIRGIEGDDCADAA